MGRGPQAKKCARPLETGKARKQILNSQETVHRPTGETFEPAVQHYWYSSEDVKYG